MADQKSSGLSQREWCRNHGIGATTFQYRCRRVRLAMEEKLQESKSDNAAIVLAERSIEPAGAPKPEPFFAKVDLAPEPCSTSGINIRYQDTLINIAPDAPCEHVKMILEVLTDAQ